MNAGKYWQEWGGREAPWAVEIVMPRAFSSGACMRKDVDKH